MDTPPQNNYKHNPEGDDFRHDLCSRVNVKPGKLGQANVPQLKQHTEKEQLQRIQQELRGQLKYIEETNWMYDNNDQI